MSEYTPTTSEILEAFAWDDKYDELSIERIDMFYRWLSKIKEEVSTKAHFEHWVAEIKAEAIAEWQAERLAAFSQSSPEPYLTAEHNHTARSSFGDPYCKSCGADLEITNE